MAKANNMVNGRKAMRKALHISRGKEDLHIPAAFHGFQHGDFVGVLDVAAHWNTHRDTG